MSWNPMLAEEGELGKITYPKVGMIKLNGVRGLNQNGKLVARSLKPLANKHTTALFSTSDLINFDGELTVGDPLAEEVFSITSSALRSVAGTPDAQWWLFDYFHPTARYLGRLEMLQRAFEKSSNDSIGLITYRILKSDADTEQYAEECLAEGAEGLVLRSPDALYKQGRSTVEEGGFLRFCPWLRSEATLITIHEGKVNLNESKANELGYLKKQTLKENMVGSGRAGAGTFRDLKSGVEFNMPIPTVKLQDEMWKHPENYIGKIFKYKFKPAVKIGGKPRFPQIEGERMAVDM